MVHRVTLYTRSACTSKFTVIVVRNKYYFIKIKVSKVGERSRGPPEGSLFDSNTPGVEEGTTPFLGLLHFILDPYLIILCVKQGGIKYQFWVIDMTRPGI